MNRIIRSAEEYLGSLEWPSATTHRFRPGSTRLSNPAILGSSEEKFDFPAELMSYQMRSLSTIRHQVLLFQSICRTVFRLKRFISLCYCLKFPWTYLLFLFLFFFFVCSSSCCEAPRVAYLRKRRTVGVLAQPKPLEKVRLAAIVRPRPVLVMVSRITLPLLLS